MVQFKRHYKSIWGAVLIASFVAAGAGSSVPVYGQDGNLGRWCGIATANQGNYPSLFHGGSSSNIVLDCQGHNPSASCPAGYAEARFSMTAWHADSIADTAYTCVQYADLALEEEVSGAWCGVEIRNPGNRPSAWVDGHLSGLVTCQGHRPSSSCPAGYSSMHLTMTSWHDDSIADSVFTCVQSAPRPIDEIDPSGTWCGGWFVNSGNYPSIWAGAAPSCLGVSPAHGCPTGFRRLQFCMTAWHADSTADCIATCVAQ